MKIEKISDTQIKCTLDKKDLLERELKVSELAYGSEKTKALFSELMIQASYECGFEAENMPLVVEAIPVSADCLVLLVTKVADPEELDARFSRLTPVPEGTPYDADEKLPPSAFADEILECFDALTNIIKGVKDDGDKQPVEKKPINPKYAEVLEHAKQKEIDIMKVFTFGSISEIVKLATVLTPHWHGTNHLFKESQTGDYYLVFHMTKETAQVFNKVCNIASEYGDSVPARYATLSYFEEHFESVIKNNALQKLTLLKKH